MPLACRRYLAHVLALFSYMAIFRVPKNRSWNESTRTPENPPPLPLNADASCQLLQVISLCSTLHRLGCSRPCQLVLISPLIIVSDRSWKSFPTNTTILSRLAGSIKVCSLGCGRFSQQVSRRRPTGSCCGTLGGGRRMAYCRFTSATYGSSPSLSLFRPLPGRPPLSRLPAGLRPEPTLKGCGPYSCT
ncbi:hypothetical protein FA95DRAFT_1399801 [Auriscalpium vulgare]|uniref:Uncharacterized protein n=1 Tax=Auriscalpium vulgare TaxID=40419 RepID=A0ACB8RRS2_9AGAM|nr:hypothetical protein FA95DRAFT_1399801 [Auriscalpium vulgare]